jgi:ubiquinone/menaquinone biosynthesis C-methylase UbiE
MHLDGQRAILETEAASPTESQPYDRDRDWTNGNGKGGQMTTKEQFFDFAAHVGLTKHLGGVEATDKLMEACHVNRGQVVLDVGCGAGATATYIAKKYGCKVVGVDISAGMIERSRERARREGLTDLVEFRRADAQDLPFEDNLFDAVITESVTAFPEDKQRAVQEYARVTKPGGYVGLNESTWLKVPPPPEVIAWASQDLGATVKPLTADEWVGLLKGAGLQDISATVHEIDTKDETRGCLQRYGCRGMARILLRTLGLYLRNPAYRRFVKEIREQGITPPNLPEYFGYGMYVGRKQAGT